MQLDIKDLHVSARQKDIIKGIDLSIKSGEFHVLMGPNGSGKTTLAMAIMGYPELEIKKGDILVDGVSILNKKPDERAKMGLFVQFQDPPEIEGVGFVNFLTSAKSELEPRALDFRSFMNEIKSNAQKLNIREELIGRSLNYGLSGGEKKKAEMLQMLVLKPKLAILDEPDSGLDVDAVKDVANAIQEYIYGSKASVLLITHYTRILKYLHPQYVHVLIDGKIARSGGPELAELVDAKGYAFDD
ncbi:MAG: Fe-S cluster assembly ATPase SufC [Candidatus Micrarchaeia archaeon]